MTPSHSHPKSVTGEGPLDAHLAPERTGAAQRQWAYRQRRRRAIIDAIGNEREASRATLLTLLAQELAALDARATPANMIEPARNGVRRVLNEIVTRYAIEL